jgi:drug/metabolite transporter (DMT)-like permease
MTRGYLPLLLTLAFVWGASYLFIKVAVDDIEPTTMMAVRCVVAAALLVPFVLWHAGSAAGWRDLRAAWRPGLVLGLTNAAIPFTLIAWGEKHIDSGVAAVANATVPIFVTLLAIRFRPSERATGARMAGILVGLVGVAVLAGAAPDVGWWPVAGILAVVLASVSYAASGLYGQGRVESISGPALAAASMAGGAVILLPFGVAQAPSHIPGWEALASVSYAASGLYGQGRVESISGPALAAVSMAGGAVILLPLGLAQAPSEMPGWESLASVAALAIGGTAFAQLVLYRTLRLHGAARLSLVTYLMPPVALLYGALLLDEPLTAAAVGGLTLILLGVALGSGAVRLPRREPAPATPHG